MNRREFTRAITTLLMEMIYAEEQPIIDFVVRSTEEQQRIFNLHQGLTKIDGVTVRSKHQDGLAMDIYLVTNRPDGTVRVDYQWDNEKAIRWHNRWVELGGRAMIEWDAPHYEAGA